MALVTGGGRGIGRATAVALARAGARVTVTARTRDEVAAVADEIGGDFIAASAATAEGCAAIVEETQAALRPHRHPRLQRGPRRVGREAPSGTLLARALARDARDQSRRAVLPQQARDGRDDAARLRAHRLRQLDGGRGRRPGAAGLLRLEARRDRADARHRPGRDPVRRHLQRRAAGLGAHAHGRRRRGRRSRCAPAARPRRSGPRTPRSTRPAACSTRPRWQPRSRSSARRKRAASTARRCESRSAASGNPQA